MSTDLDVFLGGVAKKSMIFGDNSTTRRNTLQKERAREKAPQLADDGKPLVLTFGQGKTGQRDRCKKQGRR
jgi:hypothetical protein